MPVAIKPSTIPLHFNWSRTNFAIGYHSSLQSVMTRMAHSGLGFSKSLYARLVTPRISEALLDTRVVLLVGPRQAGKTTLVKAFAHDRLPYFSLDDHTTQHFARADPTGFVRRLDRAIIDEVQRAPDLLLAIKQTVDADPRPGRFLLTGSANVFRLSSVVDSLAGRVETVRLLPLSQAEMHGQASTFLANVFAGRLPKRMLPLVLDDALVDVVLKGGFPEAVKRPKARRRVDWLMSYLGSLLQRDVHDLGQINRAVVLPRLAQILASMSGQLLNVTRVAQMLGVSRLTTQRYIDALENLFLVYTLPPFHSNALKRLIKSPKLHLLDSGLLAAVGNSTAEALRWDRTPLGRLLECFVLGELLKMSDSASGRYRLSHFRDKQQNEVDFVLEDSGGSVVGIEVKAAATVTGKDFRGLLRLRNGCGTRFKMGIVLYNHDRAYWYDRNIAAVPISSLWSAG